MQVGGRPKLVSWTMATAVRQMSINSHGGCIQGKGVSM